MRRIFCFGGISLPTKQRGEVFDPEAQTRRDTLGFNPGSFIMAGVICKHTKSFLETSVFSVRLYRCAKCDLVFRKENKSDSNPKKLYGKYYRKSRNEITVGRFRYGLEVVIKTFRFFRAYKVHALHPSARRVLDIGCGRGFMLYFLRKFWGIKKVVGTQISLEAYIFAKNKLRLSVYHEDLSKINLYDNYFDLVTIWHVLEHVVEPERYIAKIKSILKRKGKIIIEVPNYNSWSRKIAGEYWLGYDIIYHLSFFTPGTLIFLLKKYKFKILKTHTFSLEYSTFISAQSIVSRITKTDSLFFKWIQGEKIEANISMHILLMFFLLPFCLFGNLVLYYTHYGEVLLVVAEKP
ncbi:hypothetical protein A3E41_00375 [Candidatus Woesebacteria bacterium RIFCSPHIGHO2_12_FULL_38_9]|uniref:Methyltransferase type 11 domain-containing protein n=1 Tax=Candidatus Woesebacteria bacterium RIFCSPHIGHO2_01_FULL_40_22 TaxID=1802499 RepID=A0A1F7YGH1_9BACT|nr:MAG: hypothetical protein A2141_03575 [Candidatus Woesebacteria bacterium RBG_16_40_11]OGM26403.1 MAG: hypothetical protein A2628_00040 [Candidatus Woesebacteria bacterium RIFCSPHIGHO2_01_FULL_40_22]OGM36035.1 MAG: hypothetical protein A3E41_00375 [Candidatus Woesebacteria bacterium RIFCSPHIGHO2_12_FULL_38_9]